MAEINFPDNPSIDEVYVSGSNQWKWNGTFWEAIGTPGPTGDIGYTGSQGITGYTGSASNVIGYTGSQGITGYTGSASGLSGVQSVTDAATITPNVNSDAFVDITAIAQAFQINNPTGTPTNFQKLIIRIKDNGVARAITFDTAYIAGGTPLPTTTVAGKILTLGFMYNTANSLNKWMLIASAQEA